MPKNQPTMMVLYYAGVFLVTFTARNDEHLKLGAHTKTSVRILFTALFSPSIMYVSSRIRVRYLTNDYGYSN